MVFTSISQLKFILLLFNNLCIFPTSNSTDNKHVDCQTLKNITRIIMIICRSHPDRCASLKITLTVSCRGVEIKKNYLKYNKIIFISQPPVLPCPFRSWWHSRPWGSHLDVWRSDRTRTPTEFVDMPEWTTWLLPWQPHCQSCNWWAAMFDELFPQICVVTIHNTVTDIIIHLQ